MRTLVLSIGNTTISCGVFSGDRLVGRWRLPVRAASAGPSLGRLIGRCARGGIDRAVFCSVVPRLTPVVRRAIARHAGTPARGLTAAGAHGLKIGYFRPRELGTDRLACALGARALFPGKNVIVVDCGTATTVTALARNGTVLGGAILPGADLWPGMLARRTAQLPAVAVKRPRVSLGRSTRAGLQSGIFFGHAGAIRELTARIGLEAFGRAGAEVVGTGGHASRLRGEALFTAWEPDLVLLGLHVFAKSI